ncbi:hypothetical protein SAMN04515674_106139 [Pseudarcicella hirudinis]|uniref:Uncharacterized protein n=1 Tax=Pseudarcicella hirudinis TaxID=1079859 RepID=A0A1I5TPF4_9BACT|nr:hypothetical protein [Pseudarcicella hirudinis]SFP84913.1 hypothetical protein SAMN04515674_106139 [Pseudarcicella hirudinis]
MNKYLLSLLLLFFLSGISGVLMAQSSKRIITQVTLDGVYVNAKDFENQVLSYTNARKMIAFYDKVKVVQDSVLILNGKNAYGFRKDGKDWRFSEGKAYEVINKEGIFIYKLEVSNQSTVSLYYFSKDAASPLIFLSKRNLRKHYADNPSFLAILDTLPWRLHLEDAVPPFNEVRVAEMYNYVKSHPDMFYSGKSSF